MSLLVKDYLIKLCASATRHVLMTSLESHHQGTGFSGLVDC